MKPADPLPTPADLLRELSAIVDAAIALQPLISQGYADLYEGALSRKRAPDDVEVKTAVGWSDPTFSTCDSESAKRLRGRAKRVTARIRGIAKSLENVRGELQGRGLIQPPRRNSAIDEDEFTSALAAKTRNEERAYKTDGNGWREL